MMQFSAIAKASLEKVWDHLIYKIEHPENFVPGVSNVILLEKNDNFVIRKMDVLMNGATETLIEKIRFTPYNVRFELVEHPIFIGHVDNDAKFISENETEITYTINWINKTTQEPFSNPELVKNAVLKTIEFITAH